MKKFKDSFDDEVTAYYKTYDERYTGKVDISLSDFSNIDELTDSISNSELKNKDYSNDDIIITKLEGTVIDELDTYDNHFDNADSIDILLQAQLDNRNFNTAKVIIQDISWDIFRTLVMSNGEYWENDVSIYSSPEDYAYEYIDSIGGIHNLGDTILERYFDYDKFARDIKVDISYAEDEDGNFIVVNE